MQRAMRYLLLLLTLGVTGTCLYGQAITAETLGANSPQPKAHCPEPKYDWGTVFTGEEVVHSFPVVNKGDAPLIIKDVQETCSCTTVDFTKEILPGRQGHVTLKIDTKGMKKAVAKKAFAITNDPANKKLTFLFGGKLSELFEISPLFAVMKGKLGQKTPLTAQVKLKNSSVLLITSLKQLSKHKHFSIKVKEEVKGKSYTLQFATLPDLKLPKGSGNLSEEVKFEATTVGDKKVMIFLHAHVTLQPRIELSPKWLIFRMNDTNKLDQDPPVQPRRKLQVKAAAGIDFDVTKITTTGGFLSAKLLEKTKPGIQMIEITLTEKPKDAGPNASGQIVIETSDPVHPRLTLKVMAFFAVKK